MAQTRVITLDLMFQGRAQAIASYLIRSGEAVVLVESGPGSTLTGLDAALAAQGLSTRHVTHVLLTHIHLDHAGAAGRLARAGAEIYVHRVGAPHLLNPEKLLASATRIYGDRMDELWGEFVPVPEQRLHVAEDGKEIEIGNLRFLPLDTPGHAEHHFAYLFEDICFSGDVGGVRIPGYQYLRVPMVPPELHLERWRASMKRLRQQKFKYIAPTHFGMYDDPDWQLREVEKGLDEAERWIEKMMAEDPAPPIATLRESFTTWMVEEGAAFGLSEDVVMAYGLANPPGMSADGLLRYWKKVKHSA